MLRNIVFSQQNKRKTLHAVARFPIRYAVCSELRNTHTACAQFNGENKMNLQKTTENSENNAFYAEIRDMLQKSRNVAYQAVNTIMVNTYWQIGKRIVEQEQQGRERTNYGDYIIANLSRYLSDTLGKGFSEANLKNIRQFYVAFPNFDQLATHCVANLSWTHIRLIMRLGNTAEREYYIKEAVEQNWSSRVLERNINTGYYRRLISTQEKSVEAIPQKQKYNPADFIKDPYVCEFLNVPEDLKESSQIFASKYKTILPTEEELAQMIDISKKEIANA